MRLKRKLKKLMDRMPGWIERILWGTAAASALVFFICVAAADSPNYIPIMKTAIGALLCMGVSLGLLQILEDM